MYDDISGQTVKETDDGMIELKLTRENALAVWLVMGHTSLNVLQDIYWSMKGIVRPEGVDYSDYDLTADDTLRSIRKISLKEGN